MTEKGKPTAAMVDRGQAFRGPRRQIRAALTLRRDAEPLLGEVADPMLPRKVSSE
jgi:hypothetical protein